MKNFIREPDTIEVMTIRLRIICWYVGIWSRNVRTSSVIWRRKSYNSDLGKDSLGIAIAQNWEFVSLLWCFLWRPNHIKLNKTKKCSLILLCKVIAFVTHIRSFPLAKQTNSSIKTYFWMNLQYFVFDGIDWYVVIFNGFRRIHVNKTVLN